MSNPKWFKHEWIWLKNNASNFVNAKRCPLKAHENILVFGKGKVNYYPIRESRSLLSLVRSPAGISRQRTRREGAILQLTKMPLVPSVEHADGRRHPFSYQEFKKEEYYNKEYYNKDIHHPTRKPIALIEYLIRTYSLEGELILDNTAGSGTLAIACINTDRKYICIEKDEHYFEVMKSRVENHDRNAPVTPKKTRKIKPVLEGQLELF